MNADVSFDALGFDSENVRAQEDEIPPKWAELPPIAVEKIYAYLNREDQCHMSMVCKNWNREYSSPSLWRKVKFLIPEKDLNLEVYPEVQFARKYGALINHVEIVWPNDVEYTASGYHNAKLVWKQIKLFLEALTHSQLETVSFIHLTKFMRYVDASCYAYRLFDDYKIADDVFQTLKRFFSSQHMLKTIEFRDPIFSQSEAAEIFRVILRHSKSLQNLSLDEFANEESLYEEIAEYVGNEAVESLLNIKTLQLHYSNLFENMMMTFYEHTIQNSDSRRMKGNLELIKIFCDVTPNFSYRGITPECWKFWTEICPSLGINLEFYVREWSHSTNRINLFVVRNMPLKVLEIRYEKCVETEIGDLFQLLQSCRTNVEDLSIDGLQNKNNLAIDLIHFLPTCEKLKTFRLCVEHPVESHLNAVFNSWLVNRPPSLQNASITVRDVRRLREEEIYSKMADDYGPLLQMDGLELRLIVLNNESKIRKRRL